jgi:serine protease Do
VLAALALLSPVLILPAALGQELGQLPDVVDRIAVSVVSIRVEQDPALAEPPVANPPAAAAAKDQKAEGTRPAITQGTGMVLSSDGYIVTAEPVLAKARTITVTFANGAQLAAQLAALDTRTSVALLKVATPTALAPVTFADSDRLRRGQQVFAVGNPFGLSGTLSLGVVAATARDVGFGAYDLIQSDVAATPGSAGGPIFNLKGEVVGMATLMRSSSGAASGIGFALPSNLVKNVAEKLRRTGVVERGWLGVQIRDLTEEEAKSHGISRAAGVTLTSVVSGGPAATSGLAAGDAIIAVDGRPVQGMRSFARTVSEYAPNTDVKLGIVRAASRRDVQVRLGRLPNQPAATPSAPAPSPASARECTRYLPTAGMTISVPCSD